MTNDTQFNAMADYFRSMLRTEMNSIAKETDDSFAPELIIKDNYSQESLGTLKIEPALQTKVKEENLIQTRPVKEEESRAKLERIIGQVKPEPKEIITITAPRPSITDVVQTKTQTQTQPKIITEVKNQTSNIEVISDKKLTQKISQTIEVKKEQAVWKNISVDEEFQALFFVVQGVTFAVPLVELGGIDNKEKITPIFGKPEWFMGMMTVREEQHQVVDMVKWAMPQMSNSVVEPFNYVIQLGSSKWGIACHDLIGTEKVLRKDIQWRTNAGKRPWLAGLVKEKMCAMIHVEELIKLFNQGVNIEGN